MWPYNEATGTGELRYVQLTANSHAASSRPSPSQYADATVQMALVWNAGVGDQAAVTRAETLAAALWARHGAKGEQVRYGFVSLFLLTQLRTKGRAGLGLGLRIRKS